MQVQEMLPIFGQTVNTVATSDESQLISRAFSVARHVIFDFDGVIADSEEFQLRIWEELLREHALSLEGLSITVIAGISDHLAIERICSGLTAAVYDGLVAEKKRRCSERAWQIRPVPGIHELLRSVHGSMRLHICSSSSLSAIRDFLQRVLPHFLFDSIVSREDYSRRKPDPEPYLTLLSRAQVLSTEAVVIEDSFTGVQAAQAAGIPVIHLDRYGQNLTNVPSVTSLQTLATVETDRDTPSALPRLSHA